MKKLQAVLDFSIMAEVEKFDEPMRIALGKSYKILWKPVHCESVLVDTVKPDAEKDVELRLEEHVGMVRVFGKDLPVPERIVAIHDFTVYQEVKNFKDIMVLHEGTYDIYLYPGDKKDRILVETKLEVKPGKVIEIE